ncbi:MAG: AIR synthase-related protein, partial [Streptosporangiaceae bacterium]
TVAHALLAEHRSYLAPLRPLLPRLHGLAHITGGGIPGNLPRILPAGCAAEIELSAWEPPPLFQLLQRLGKISDGEMRRTFNLGIGMIAVAAPSEAAAVTLRLRGAGEEPVRLGAVVRGARRVIFRP